jgi:hypothetical protein
MLDLMLCHEVQILHFARSQDNQEEECRFWKHYSLSRGRADLLSLELCFLYQLCENAIQASIQIRQLSISKHPSLPCIPPGHACPLDRNDISATSCGGWRKFKGLNTFWIWLESAPDLSERQSSKMPMASRSPFQDPGSPLLADIWGELSGNRASYSTSKYRPSQPAAGRFLAKAPTKKIRKIAWVYTVASPPLTSPLSSLLARLMQPLRTQLDLCSTKLGL